jgi:hypothetical protein
MIQIAAILIGLSAATTLAAITGIGDWSQIVVLGGIVLVSIGTMIATEPLRKER